MGAVWGPRSRWIAAWSLALLAGGGCSAGTFLCESEEQCVSDQGAGQCEPSGFCSFVDSACASGQRYGGLAPGGLSNECVPPTADGSSGEAGADDLPGTTLSTSETVGSTTLSPTATTGGTVGTDDSNSTSDAQTGTETGPGGDTGSSTGGEPQCCSAECSTCSEACEVQVLAQTDEIAESLDVVVVGDHVVWNTGTGGALVRVDVATGAELALASFSPLATHIAADDTHVYMTSHGSPLIRRVHVLSGALEVVTGAADVGQAHFGRIAVDDTHVYFARHGSGGVWRAPKDLSAPSVPELVSDAEAPLGVAVDETAVYYTESNSGELRRVDLDAADPDSYTVVAVVGGAGPVQVDDADVYYAHSGSVSRIAKDAVDGSGTLMYATGGLIEGLVLDEVDVYFNDMSTGRTLRVAKDGLSPGVEIADTSEPWGIAVGCGHVYWCEHGTRSLLSRPK